MPSHLYSYSFEPNHLWSRRFSRQPEILDYLERCVEKYGLAEHLRLGEAVATADFDEHRGRWTVRTAASETLEAEALVAACGQLSRPVHPPIAGLERFEGPWFHSARWDHDLDLRGKRVAVVGTGASAIQFVPQIAPLVERLHVFQRSAPYVIPKPDRPYHGWQRRLWRRFPQLQAISRFYVWGLLEVFIAGFTRTPRVMSIARRGFERQLRDQITDPELRRALTPDYEMGCKRILVSSEYYEALARPNVEVVTDPVREVLATGIVDASGEEREVDAIIFGTGFAANDFLSPMEVRGLGGRELNQAWRDGAEAYLGICVSGFPNMFILYGPNTNLGAGSIIYMLEQQIAYSVAALRVLSGSGAAYLDLREDVQRRFNRELQRRLGSTVWQSGCTSWYVNDAGRNTNNWPGFMSEYRRRTARLDHKDYRLVPAT